MDVEPSLPIRGAPLSPADVMLQRQGREVKHRNGIVEAAIADVAGTRLVYRITAE